MKESEINAIVKGNQERNQELLRTLVTKGVTLDEQRSIEHHFWANSQREAALLGKELYTRGFLVFAISPVNTDDGSTVWNVEAAIEQSPSSAASRQVTEELTRVAANFDAIYDGWGTSV